ncbi:InlB B-repeat-containing protein [Carboxylicivirga sp. RSCT41]|uniref:InlB B-repeat-containing protein n=1 Tax=Carboxylicivirga agarovorans TaxID=3417570 RepID=UPI003D3260A0
MKKNYLALLLSLIVSVSFAQVEIVKDYYPTDNEWGVNPDNLISNSEMIVFSGAVNAQWVSFWGSYSYQYEPFVTDGTTNNFLPLDINPGATVASSPGYYFVLSDEIYCTATDGEGEKLFKINDVTGAFEAAATWLTGNAPVVDKAKSTYDTDKILFAGTNPADDTDDNMYLLKWDGVTASPELVHTSQAPIYDVNIGNKLTHLGGARDYYVIYAKDPNNAALGYQCCITSTFWGTTSAVFFDLVTDFDDYLEGFTVVDSKVYFNDRNNIVWSTQGAEPAPVTDINDNIKQNTNLQLLGEYEGKLVLVAEPAASATDHRRIMLYDPAKTGADAITILGERDTRNVRQFAVLDGMIYLSANERLYDTDGTTYIGSKTGLFCYDGQELHDVSGNLDFVGDPVAFNGKLYFSAEDQEGVDNGDGTFSTTHSELFSYTPSVTYYLNYMDEGGIHTNIDRFSALTATTALNDVTREGYSSFDGWYTTEDFQAGTEITEINPAAIEALITSGDIVPVDNAGQMTINIYAKFSGAVAYTLTFDALEGTDNNIVSEYTVADEVALVDPTPPLGYKVYRWYTEYTAPSTFSGDYYTSSIPKGTTGNLTLYARYLTVSYTITYELNGGDKDGKWYDTSYDIDDAPVVFNTPVKTGYNFGGWYTTPDFQNGTELTEVSTGSTGDITVYAKWDTATAIDDNFINAVAISPNPSYGFVYVTSLEGKATYEIYSVAGSLLESGMVANGQIDYTVQAGVYLLKITEGSNTKVVKIMVK